MTAAYSPEQLEEQENGSRLPEEDRPDFYRERKGLANADAKDNKPTGISADPRNKDDKRDSSSFYHPTGRGGGSGNGGLAGRLRGRITKKKAIGGGVITASIGGLIALFTIVSGPLQLEHLSQTLMKNFHHQQDTTQTRTKGLYRYFRTGKIGETRVSRLGSKIVSKAFTQLEEVGFKVTGTNARGTPTEFTIDTEKYPELKDIPLEKRPAAMADLWGDALKDPKVLKHAGGGIWKINLNPAKLADLRFTKVMLHSALQSLDNGLVQTGLQGRAMARFFDLPSLFHPIKALKSLAGNKISAVAAAKNETARQKPIEDAVANSDEALSTKAKVESRFGDLQGALNKAINFATFGTALLCAIRNGANDAVALNRYAVVLPSTVQAVDKIAVGAQNQAGSDLSLSQLGAIARSFKDPKTGKTIWDAKALQVLAGHPDPGGEDLPKKYTQSFAGTTTAHNVRSAVHVPAAAVSCSAAGQAVLAAVNIIATAVSVITDTEATWAAVLTRAAVSGIAFGGVTYFLQQEIKDLLNNKAVVPEVLSGPLGGNLLAFGAREAANISSRASGGVAMAGTETETLTLNDQTEEEQQFQTEPLAKRLFDIHDYRSSISRLIDGSSPSLTQNLAKIANIFTSPFKTMASAFSALTPHTAAAEAYNWGFPLYGISDSLADNPRYENPYDNADQVAKILDSSCVGVDDTGKHFDTGCKLRERALKCFGVDISKYNTFASQFGLSSYGDPGKWKVVAVEDVNPGSDRYRSGDCDDTSDTWNRIRLFIADSRIMDSIACYDNDDQSCTNLGTGSAADNTGTISAGPGSVTAGSQIVGNIGESSDTVACADNTKDIGVVTSKYTGGLKQDKGPLLIRLCQLSSISGNGNNTQGAQISGGAVVNSRVSGAWETLGEAAKQAGVNLDSLSSFRLEDSCNGSGDGNGCAHPGQSMHQLGVAIDFSSIYHDMGGEARGDSCSSREVDASNSEWNWLNNNAAQYGFKQYSREAWHWDALNDSSRCGGNGSK